MSEGREKDAVAKAGVKGKSGARNAEVVPRRRDLRRPVVPIVTAPAMFADEVAQMARDLRVASEGTTRCDACDDPIDGEPAGRGLYLWTRGGDASVRVEEPPLCAACALAIGVSAHLAWAREDDEEG